MSTTDYQMQRRMQLGQDIMAHMSYEPNEEQVALIAAFSHFVMDPDEHAVFVLNGYAGTGKTSLTGAIVKAMGQEGRKVVLLAPTGRAARIFGDYSGHAAFTIHRKIYRQRAYMDTGFGLAENKHTETLFIVDEASMIANSVGEGATFGTGRLLDDLIHYVYSGRNCRLMLMGDQAQLPPVGQTDSPALRADVLQGYGLHVHGMNLTQIARQAQQSSILRNATIVRRGMATDAPMQAPKLELETDGDVQTVSGEFFLEKLSDCYDGAGLNETIVVTRSNRRATMYNQGIRNRILWREDELSSGDMLIVARNNYFWAADYDELDFIANGDIVSVRRVHGEIEERYGLRFANVTLEFPDHNGLEMEAKIILDCLASDTPALPPVAANRMYTEIFESLSGTKAQRYAQMKKDPYFNALQVKFAYAVTCHKAQGGQWQNVFVDMGDIVPDALTSLDFHRWFYTALTRARNTVYLVNSPLESNLTTSD